MQKTNSKKYLVHSIISAVLIGGAIIAVCVWGFMQRARAAEYKNATEAMFIRAYNELSNELSDLSVTLSKLLIVGSRSQHILLLDDVWRSSGTAAGLYSQLPASHASSAETNAFIIRTGDYARSLTNRVLRGEVLTQADYEQIKLMRDTARRLSSELAVNVAEGKLSLDLLDNEGYFTVSNEESAGESSEASEQELPTLIYDGPFSESSETAKAKSLTGSILNEKQALDAANSFVPEGAALKLDGKSNGKIPAFDFSGTTADGRFIEVSVTQQGGALIWLMSGAVGTESGVAQKQRERVYAGAANATLSKLGFKAMMATYAQYYSGMVVINFAATQGNCVLYSDLIKVYVDRETEAVIGIDARNYVLNHTQRELQKPELTVQEAEVLVSPNLKVLNRQLSLIPLTPQREVLCYEFKGSFDGEEYIVYINAVTGDEEQVFMIINSEEGSYAV